MRIWKYPELLLSGSKPSVVVSRQARRDSQPCGSVLRRFQKPSGFTRVFGKFKNAWGRLYIYRMPGLHNTNGFDVSSGGPNARPGTSEEIGNWPQAK